jgi:hypothetical protein
MKTDVNLEMYQNIDIISAKLRSQIAQLEQEIDEFCSGFVKTQEDLQMVSLFTSMLNDLYLDLEQIDDVRGALYN